MRTSLLLTVVGTDRTGLVEALARKLAELGGNWEEARLAHLAGQFAGIVLVTVDTSQSDALVAGLRGIAGLQLTVHPAAAKPAAPGGHRVRIEVTADDRPGIVRELSRVLAERGVNIEELESAVASAPMSGEALFRARATVLVPPTIALADLRTALEALAGEMMIDLSE
jgi:glycine cleavage system regulatory protein